MKTTIFILSLLLIAPLVVSADNPVSKDKTAAGQVLEIEVKGMTCPFCVYSIKKKLGKLPGVKQAEVSLKEKRARVVMQPGHKPDEARIRKAIIDAGFTPGKTIPAVTKGGA